MTGYMEPIRSRDFVEQGLMRMQLMFWPAIAAETVPFSVVRKSEIVDYEGNVIARAQKASVDDEVGNMSILPMKREKRKQCSIICTILNTGAIQLMTAVSIRLTRIHIIVTGNKLG